MMAVADIFLDVASGSNVVNRPEFQRLLESAQNGKINYVVTKAVSRFGRSTEDVLVATRALKECGVEVYFDDQEFGSFNPEAELLYSISTPFKILSLLPIFAVPRRIAEPLFTAHVFPRNKMSCRLQLSE